MQQISHTPTEGCGVVGVECGQEWLISMVNQPRSFLELLTVTVELVAVRSVLRELIRLAAQAPVLADEQLRFRLLALAECAAPRSHVPPRSPAGRWLSETPDSAPGGQPAPQHTGGVRRE